ncbi:hypothetical protein NDU88_008956 [Pleurodeles waltl]|uniref:Uncharacterized protein n=1 Tax=Pleurodeles waltl TaxID=8319 RepID=A0AAV7QRA9_PLEWA|nr:hypothetical protein NDU88_008956 [Pleurodeles waltl]
MPRPAIPLWLLRPDLLGDPEYKKDLQGVLDGYLHTNWGTATTRGLELEALKVIIRGESLSKTYGIRQRLYRELTQQEEVLAAIQRQVDSGDTSEADCLEVRGRIVDLWDRLDNYVRRNYRLFREGDHSGRMLAWFRRRERPIPIIQMLCGSSGERILGQLQVNTHLREPLQNIYTSPRSVGVTQIQEYLDGLRMPRLTKAQVEELEGEVSLEDLVEALGGKQNTRAPPLTSDHRRRPHGHILEFLLRREDEACGLHWIQDGLQEPICPIGAAVMDRRRIMARTSKGRIWAGPLQVQPPLPPKSHHGCWGGDSHVGLHPLGDSGPWAGCDLQRGLASPRLELARLLLTRCCSAPTLYCP